MTRFSRSVAALLLAAALVAGCEELAPSQNDAMTGTGNDRSDGY